LKTLKQAEDLLKKEWGESMSSADKARWADIKKTRAKNLKIELKAWRVTVRDLSAKIEAENNVDEVQNELDREQREAEEDEHGNEDNED
jgi:hypothetical protein